ncbi:MAG: hypothetical protein EBR82_76725 [Caulobacteraceae bacterium]|nr:hypothetical protein [Caulobacteraceae bacterium]
MFSYYGSKGKIVDYYPPPKHKRLIEPFAGSARYSLKYFDRDVTLYDKYPVIIDVWKYLQQASEKDILALPRLERGEKFKDHTQLSEIEKKFYGFITQAGSTGERYTVGTMQGVNVDADLKKIAKQLFKIRHWEIKLGCYTEIPNEEATWFIDPPYQFGGHEYKHSNKKINFTELGEWCKERNGQIIVCENTKANWLPFKPMLEMQGTMFKTTEAIYSNHKTNYDNEQILLQF